MSGLIKLTDLVVEYPILQSSTKFVNNSIAAGLVGGLLGRNKNKATVRALNKVSLEVEPGAKVGLVGHNGSGKTTLLRLLAGVLKPTSGELEVKGSVVPLLDQGLGLSDLLSARENVELPMRLLGASSQEIAQSVDSIIEFSDLGEFANLPMRMYSQGMKARLAFAISTAVRGDILLLDEWLGAGDLSFVEKASARIDSMLKESKILILASHSLDLLTKVCDRVLWIDHGDILMDGAAEPVCRAYWEDARRKQLAALGIDAPL